MNARTEILKAGAVTAFDAAAFDPVTIPCPICGASETASHSRLAGAPGIVCRNCGETWPVFATGTKRRDADNRDRPGAAATTLDAVRRPLVTYSAGEGRAWAAKAEADRVPEPRRISRIPAMAAGMAALLFIGAFFGGREAAVAAIPDLAGLYAALGLSVNLQGLRIEQVQAERRQGPDGERLVVRGVIVNVSRSEGTLPGLIVGLRDSAMRSSGSFVFRPPAQTIASGGSAPFELQLPEASPQASDVVIRFRRAAEPLQDPAGPAAAPQ